MLSKFDKLFNENMEQLNSINETTLNEKIWPANISFHELDLYLNRHKIKEEDLTKEQKEEINKMLVDKKLPTVFDAEGKKREFKDMMMDLDAKKEEPKTERVDEGKKTTEELLKGIMATLEDVKKSGVSSPKIVEELQKMNELLGEIKKHI